MARTNQFWLVSLTGLLIKADLSSAELSDGFRRTFRNIVGGHDRDDSTVYFVVKAIFASRLIEIIIGRHDKAKFIWPIRNSSISYRLERNVISIGPHTYIWPANRRIFNHWNREIYVIVSNQRRILKFWEICPTFRTSSDLSYPQTPANTNICHTVSGFRFVTVIVDFNGLIILYTGNRLSYCSCPDISKTVFELHSRTPTDNAQDLRGSTRERLQQTWICYVSEYVWLCSYLRRIILWAQVRHRQEK